MLVLFHLYTTTYNPITKWFIMIMTQYHVKFLIQFNIISVLSLMI
jgi:hypothetical protein